MLKSRLSGVGLIVAFAVLSCLQAGAQNCADWVKISAWTGSFSVTASGTNVSAPPWTVTNMSSTASSSNVNLTPLQGQSCSGGVLAWSNGLSGIDPNASGSFSKHATSTCTTGGASTDDVTGSGNASFVSEMLVMDFSTNTYRVFIVVSINGTEDTVLCGIDFGAIPISLALQPGIQFPPFALPFLRGPLSGTSAPVQAPDPNGSELEVVPWTLTFNLNPVTNDNQDDPCPEEGGSTIGCQNQSLGEDVPITGTGFFLHYEGDRAPGRVGAYGVATADVQQIGGWTLSVHHAYDPGSNTLFLGNGGQRSAWQFGAPVTFNGNTLITSEDGSEVYAFSGTTGQHLQTLKPLTGAVKYQFGYDPAGYLTTVTDGSGNVTTIQRDASEHATAIVSPFSQTTTLSLDSNNFLSQVTDPAGHTAMFTNTSGGLITARTDANGNIYNYSYDSQGRLTLDSDPAGGSTTVSRTDSSTGYSVTTTSALGRTSTFQVTTGVPGEQFTNTWPNGLQATMTNLQQNGQLSENTALPDGTTTSSTMGPDPRWGLQAPVPVSGTQTLGNLSMTTTGSRTATLGTPGNPFSLTTQTDTETINGRVYTSAFTGASKTFLDTSPAKRTTTRILDSLERISSLQIGALLPMTFAYDTNGRLSAITQGTRQMTLTYDSNGFLASSTDPLNLATGFTHDVDGRLLTTTLPDGRLITYTYDANGNLTSVTPPGKSAHDFSYTVVDLPSLYTPPVVTGTGATSYAYNADRDLTTVTRPDGQTIDFAYDTAGRLSSTTTSSETISYAYDVSTGNLSSASISGGEAIAYGYNGPLPTSSTWTGPVAGSVSRTFNNNFWVASQSVNGANTVNLTYDKDGLLTKAGTLTLKRDAKDGVITGSSLAAASDAVNHNTFGEVIGYTAKVKIGATTTTLDKVAYTLDADSRITTKTETIGGKKTAYAYTYDAAGRLTTVKQNGVTASTYTYDSNSNRLSQTTSSGTVNGTYDAQDRLLTWGASSFTYTANGELATQTVGSQTTTYTYDVLGNLTAATLPNGTRITYVVDASNRRVGKLVNGVLQAGYLYDGRQLVAQLNGSNQIVNQFVYGSRSNSPDYMIQGGVTYRIFSDQLGSPRLVINTSTGATAERMDYDEFGNVINDTNPGFQPFGFAGGLYDQDTKLVRFGARDYNPAIGRWTAKDPIRFGGGDTNLYGYVLGDPINLTDSAGHEPEITLKMVDARVVHDPEITLKMVDARVVHEPEIILEMVDARVVHEPEITLEMVDARVVPSPERLAQQAKVLKRIRQEIPCFMKKIYQNLPPIPK